MDTDTSTEAVEALMEGVTLGDWSYIGEEDNDFVVFAGGEAFLANVAGGMATPLYAPDERGVVAFDIEDQANARFIAASRQLVPALLNRAEKAERELYAFKLAFAGGEDAPGAAARVTVEDVERWRREQADIDGTRDVQLAALKAERDALREAGQMALAAFDALNVEQGSWRWRNWSTPVPLNSKVTDLEAARALLGDAS